MRGRLCVRWRRHELLVGDVGKQVQEVGWQAGDRLDGRGPAGWTWP